MIVAHQDDETIFGGGLLTNICENCSLTLICMSEAKYKHQVIIRNDEFKRVCQLLDAEPIFTSFKDSDRVGSNVNEFFRERANQILEMRAFLKEQKERIQPDIVITHNAAGEYGHCYHKVVHRLCTTEFKNVYTFGIGSNLKTIPVHYVVHKKRELLNCYPRFKCSTFCDTWLRGYDLTYKPERYFIPVSFL